MKIAFALFAVLLSACASAPPATTVKPRLTFEHVQPIPLNVARIEVVNAFQPPLSQEHVEHLMPSSPAESAKALVEKALVAEGYENTLRVIVEDASVTREKLPVAKDFWGNFSREPSERYFARVALRFELASDQAPDIVTGRASVVADRTKTILEHTSPADRDRAYFALSEELMEDVYNGLNTTVRDTFGRK